MRLLAAVVIVGSATLGLAAQRDATARPNVVGTAVLSGQTVTAEETARPLRRVLVTLSGAEVRGDRKVMTDDDGRFSFEGLVAGRYTLTAEKPAYVTIHHGSPRPGFGPGTPVALADGQKQQVTLRIPRGAVIAGVVRTPGGQPLASAQVQLGRIQSVAGVLSMVGRTTTTTDEKGRFRYYGLPPGEYVLRGTGNSSTNGEIRMTTAAEIEAATRAAAAVTRAGPAPLAPAQASPPIPRINYAAMYAPNSVDLEGAQRYRVGLGQEVLDVDITIALVRTGAISGVSLGPTGDPLPNVMISVVNTKSRSLWISPGGVRPDANGRFRLAGLPEGEWALIGRAADPAASQGPMLLYAETPFTMTGDDLTDLQLSFQRGSTVSGRVEVAGGAMPMGLRLGLTAVGAISGSSPAPAGEGVQPDGTFAFSGVAPGRYRLTATGAGNLALRAAWLGDVDTLDGAFEVSPRQDIAAMRVVMTSQPTRLTGTLFDGLGRPAPEYAVVVFSTDRAHWSAAPRRMTGLVKLDSAGSYRISGLPPGTYYFAAVTDADPSELADPAFLEQLTGASITITLTEGEAKVQDLRIK